MALWQRSRKYRLRWYRRLELEEQPRTSEGDMNMKKKRDFPYMTREDLKRHRARYNTNNTTLREDLRAMAKEEQKDNKSKTTNNKDSMLIGYFIAVLLSTSGMILSGVIIDAGYSMLALRGLPPGIVDAFLITAIGIILCIASGYGLFRASAALGGASFERWGSGSNDDSYMSN